MSVRIIPNNGLVVNLEAQRSALTGASGIHLYINDYTPVAATAFTDFVEPTWSGYAPITPDWTAAAILSGVAICDSQELIFDCESDPGSDLVYGWFWLHSGGTAILLAERFTDPVTPIEGQPVRLTVRWKYRNP